MALKIYKKQNPIVKKLQDENQKLKQEINQLKQILANIKIQYQNLYNDFESYKKITKQKEKSQQTDTLIKIIKQIIPLIENIRLSIENIPEDIKNHQWVKWIELTYKNLLKTLENVNVYQLDSIWKEPNEIYHEPIWTQQVENDKKGKIIKEHQKCYIYKDWWTEIVISPAKVVVGV